MATETLTSDRINYLIWRYLVESDYHEAAVHLQKEWDVADPQALPFAPHVTNHALVALLNRGLLYHAVERETIRSVAGDGAAVSGFFGPQAPARGLAPAAAAYPEKPQHHHHHHDHDHDRGLDHDLDHEHEHDHDHEHEHDDGLEQQHHLPRKRLVDSEPILNITNSEPPIKRPRLSNGFENGFDAAALMDVDEESNGHHHPLGIGIGNGAGTGTGTNGNAYPSPEQAPSPLPVTLGPDQETQAEKVTELGPDTMFLELNDDLPSSSSACSTRSPVLLQCEWSPRDAAFLAAAGTEALARIWTLARLPAESGKLHVDPVLPPHQNLLDDSVPASTMVTCLAWSPDGSMIAVASEPVDDGTAQIDVHMADGSLSAAFHAFESPIVSLRWNPDSTACLAISPGEGAGGVSASLAVLVLASQDCIRASFPLQQSFLDQAPEAAWTSNDEFVVCRGETLVAFHCSGGAIAAARKFETREGHALSKITFDGRSRLLATASDTGMIDVWDHSGQCHSFNAHQGTITSLLWQPLLNDTPLINDSQRLLVSAGEDGAISIWNARSSETKSRCSMTMDSAVVALAFTPDGAFIAGATTQRILIWKIDDVHAPRASWVRGVDPGWQTPQSAASTPDEDQHCLGWDADGQKLAYGVNSQLAVINFRR